MVRLLPANATLETKRYLSFQSHNGAIAALSAFLAQALALDCFNPTMVRLLLCDVDLNDFTEPNVSIPQWCDCCGIADFVREALEEVSIPQWCDCCREVVDAIVRAFCVSIPQWCDCCRETAQSCSEFPSVSIPQWCDCCAPAGWRETKEV